MAAYKSQGSRDAEPVKFEDSQRCFQSWEQRFNHCMELEEDYCEGDYKVFSY